MNINDFELLAEMIRDTVRESPHVQVKEIRLRQEASGDKRLEVTLDVETMDGCRTLGVATTINRDILRNDNSDISNYFPMLAKAVKKKVAEHYDTTIEIERWNSRHIEQRNKPSVS